MTNQDEHKRVKLGFYPPNWSIYDPKILIQRVINHKSARSVIIWWGNYSAETPCFSAAIHFDMICVLWNLFLWMMYGRISACRLVTEHFPCSFISWSYIAPHCLLVGTTTTISQGSTVWPRNQIRLFSGFFRTSVLIIRVIVGLIRIWLHKRDEKKKGWESFSPPILYHSVLKSCFNFDTFFILASILV